MGRRFSLRGVLLSEPVAVRGRSPLAGCCQRPRPCRRRRRSAAEPVRRVEAAPAACAPGLCSGRFRMPSASSARVSAAPAVSAGRLLAPRPAPPPPCAVGLAPPASPALPSSANLRSPVRHGPRPALRDGLPRVHPDLRIPHHPVPRPLRRRPHPRRSRLCRLHLLRRRAGRRRGERGRALLAGEGEQQGVHMCGRPTRCIQQGCSVGQAGCAAGTA